MTDTTLEVCSLQQFLEIKPALGATVRADPRAITDPDQIAELHDVLQRFGVLIFPWEREWGDEAALTSVVTRIAPTVRWRILPGNCRLNLTKTCGHSLTYQAKLGELIIWDTAVARVEWPHLEDHS